MINMRFGGFIIFLRKTLYLLFINLFVFYLALNKKQVSLLSQAAK
jgi:hypothetical protein